MIGKLSLASFTPTAISRVSETVPDNVADAFVQLGELHDLEMLSIPKAR